MTDTSTSTDGSSSVFDTGATPLNTGGLGGLSALFGGNGGLSNALMGSTSPFDFSGGVQSGYFDPSTFASAFSGGPDSSGYTTQQIQSADPGSQLQQATGTDGTQGNQPPSASYQPLPWSNQTAPTTLQDLYRQVPQMNGPQVNPWSLAASGPQGQAPSVSPRVGTPQANIDARWPTPGEFNPSGPPPGQVTPAEIDDPNSAYNTAPVSQGGARGDVLQQPYTTGVVERPPPATGTPDPGSEQDPAQQAARQQQQIGMPPQVQQIAQQFLRSPIGQLLNQLTGGLVGQMLSPQGLGNLAAMQRRFGNQVPRGYTAQNMPPWLTPEQYQQYRQTGQIPPRTASGGPGAVNRGDGSRDTVGQGTPPTGDPNVFNTGTQPVPGTFTGPFGGPTAPGQADMTGTVDSAKIPQPSPDVQRAITQAQAAPYPTNSIQGQQANVMATSGPGYTDGQGNRRTGMSPTAIAGVFANIMDESRFNPTMRHPDQPRYGGEAHYAHGLYQEGGPDWPAYQRFLNGRDWRNPTLQTQFMMQHFAQRNPQAWNAMNNAPSPRHAAVIFLNNYLVPALQYRQSRGARYMRGVPSLNQQLSMQ